MHNNILIINLLKGINRRKQFKNSGTIRQKIHQPRRYYNKLSELLIVFLDYFNSLEYYYQELLTLKQDFRDAIQYAIAKWISCYNELDCLELYNLEPSDIKFLKEKINMASNLIDNAQKIIDRIKEKDCITKQ